MIPEATHLKALSDKDSIEEAIRREADPRGLYNRDLLDTAGLVKDIKQRHKEAIEQYQEKVETLEREKSQLCQKVNSQKEEAQQTKNYRNDFCELSRRYRRLDKNNEFKDGRIEELEEKAKDKFENHETYVRCLKEARDTWKTRYNARDKERIELNGKIRTLEADHRGALFKVEAARDDLEKTVAILQERMADSRENGNLRVANPENYIAGTGDVSFFLRFSRPHCSRKNPFIW